MNGIEFRPIVKWILIVLAAAFIGQFGKVFANYLLKRIKAGKTVGPSQKNDVPLTPGKRSGADRPEDTAGRSGVDAKTEKKALKALLKLRKKEK